jgi:hypothetical protein|eukprot:COSAG01_NODE_2133_length_8348_cov_440.231058_5_plen_67_part_00
MYCSRHSTTLTTRGGAVAFSQDVLQIDGRGCLAAIGALKKGRSRHIRLTVSSFLNAKKAIKKGDVV